MTQGIILASSSPIVPQGDELVVGTVAFLIIFAIFWKKLLPNIRETLEKRSDLIEGGMKRAEEAQAAAHELQEEYARKLIEARHEAAKITEHAREQGAVIVADMRREGQEQRETLVASGRAQLDAVALAGKIVGESLEDEARQRGTVDRFLEDLEAKADAQEAAKSSVGAS